MFAMREKERPRERERKVERKGKRERERQKRVPVYSFREYLKSCRVAPRGSGMHTTTARGTMEFSILCREIALINETIWSLRRRCLVPHTVTVRIVKVCGTTPAAKRIPSRSIRIPRPSKGHN